jgi:hypothetical protein
MASNRQIEANRNNAKRSTGPKTEAGKTRSSRNALRHGMSRSASEDGTELDMLARAIAACLEHQASSSTTMGLARAKLGLAQIRSWRHTIFAALLERPSLKQIKRMAGLERYERAARAKQHRALHELLRARTSV